MQDNDIQAEQLSTLEEFLNWSTDYFAGHDLFYGHGTDNPWDEAVMIALFVLKLPAQNDRSLLAMQLSTEQRQALVDLARRRVEEKMPVPYLTNEAWFAGERYYVNQDVIIPRSPMSETIAADFQPWLGDMQPQNILDLCTGSGCLAIYCSKQFPGADIDAVDISPKAIAIAQRNIKLHNCETKVRAIQSDLFSDLNGKKYDIIISNPPYVSAQEMQDLPSEYLHEPELALVSGEDGLDLTIEILRQASDYLSEDGLLFVEVGYSWPALVERYPDVPFTWLEFAYGGEGVFLLTAKYLRELKI